MKETDTLSILISFQNYLFVFQSDDILSVLAIPTAITTLKPPVSKYTSLLFTRTLYILPQYPCYLHISSPLGHFRVGQAAHVGLVVLPDRLVASKLDLVVKFQQVPAVVVLLALNNISS